MKNYIIPLIASVSLGAVAQLLLKKASVHLQQEDFLEKIKLILNSKFLWIGLTCYGLSMFFWLYVLSSLELSKAYPLVSLGYIATLLLGYFFLNEAITIQKISGIIAIMLGVYLLTK